MAQEALLEVLLTAASDNNAVVRIKKDFAEIKKKLDEQGACKIYLHIDKSSTGISKLKKEISEVFEKIDMQNIAVSVSDESIAKLSDDIGKAVEEAAKLKKSKITLHLDTTATKAVFADEISEILKDLNIKNVELSLKGDVISKDDVSLAEQYRNNLERIKEIGNNPDIYSNKNFKEILDSYKAISETNISKMNDDDIAKNNSELESDIAMLEHYKDSVDSVTSAYKSWGRELRTARAYTTKSGKESDNKKFKDLSAYIKKASADMKAFHKVIEEVKKGELSLDSETFTNAFNNAQESIIKVSDTRNSISNYIYDLKRLEEAVLRTRNQIYTLDKRATRSSYNDKDGLLSNIIPEIKSEKAIIDSLMSEINEVRDSKGTKEISETFSERLGDLQEKVYKTRLGFNGLASAIATTTSQERKISVETRKSTNEILQMNKILSQAQAYYTKYKDKLSQNPELDSKFQNYISKVKVNAFQGDVTLARKTLAELQNECVSAGITTESLREKLQRLFGQHLDTAIAMGALFLVKQSLRQAYDNVVELNTAMTELRKTTSETDTAYRLFFDNAAERAKKYGSSMSDIINSTADFTRLGFTLADSEILADAAIMYKNVADGIDDISESTEVLISTMKAFNIEADDVNRIIDIFNEVGNNYAISSSDIGEALKRSASALNAAGNSLEKSVALVVAMNDSVQDADKVGTALKTVSMYLRAAKTEAEDAGIETDGMANSVSELRNELLALTNQKVDIMIDSDTFKDTYEIFKDLSAVWNSLTDVNRANILELIGGKRNGDVVMSLINNFKDAEKALNTAANESVGSAAKENEKVLNSIEGKLSQVDAAFQKLSADLLDENTIKAAIDLLKGFIETIDNLTWAFGNLGTVASTAIAALFSNKIGVFQYNALTNRPEYSLNKGLDLGNYDDIKNQLSEYTKIIKYASENKFTDPQERTAFINSTLKTNISDLNPKIKELAESTNYANISMEKFYASATSSSKGVKGVLQTLNYYNKNIKGNEQATKDFTAGLSANNPVFAEFIANNKNATLRGWDYVKYLVKAKVATIGMEVATVALNTALTMGVSLAISFVIQRFIDLGQAEEEAAEKAKELGKEAKNTSDEVSSLFLKYLELSKAVEAGTGSKEELKSTTNELLKALGLEGIAVSTLTEKYGSLEEAISNVSLETLKSAHGDLVGSVAEYEKTLLEKGKSNATSFTTWALPDYLRLNRHIDELEKEQIQEYEQQFYEIGDALRNIEGLTLTYDVDTTSYAPFMTEPITDDLSKRYNIELSGDESTIEGIKQNYETLMEMQDALIAKFGANEAGKLPIFDFINGRISELKTAYENYTNEVNALNQNAAKTAVLESLKGKELPKTQDEFKNFYDNLIDDATESDSELRNQFIGSENDIIKSLEAAIQSMGVFDDFVIKAVPVEISNNIKELNSKLTELKETYTATFDNQDKFQMALDKIKNGTSLTSDEILGLIEIYPDLATQFSKTADGWTINSDSIISANEMVVKSTKESIQEQIDGYQKIVDKYNKAKDVMPNGNSMGMPSDVLSMFSNNLAQLASDAEDAQKQIDILNLILQMFGFTTGNQTKTLADYIRELSDTKSTVEEIKDILDNNGTLTANDLQKAIEQYPQLENSLRAYLAGLKSQEDIYNELADCYNQDLDNFKTYLANKSIDDESTWDKFIENSGDWVNSLADMYALDLAHLKTYKQFSDELKNSISNNIPDSTAALAHYQNLEKQSFEEFKGLFGNVEDIISGSGDNSSSSSVTLPEEYAKLKKALEHEYAMGIISARKYYLELNNLAEIWLKNNSEYADEYMSVQESIYSGLKSLYSEQINNQIEDYENVLEVLKNINQEKIDALNKEKELLQDNADEEQRILDLKQAQLDLENAKKKTTWVITEQGLKQVRDEKSVKEAQEKLNKLEIESKTAQIDKKIKSLESENDNYDKIKNDWQNKVNLENAKNFIGSDNIKNAVTEGFKEAYTNALDAKETIDNLDKENKYLDFETLLSGLGNGLNPEQVRKYLIPTLFGSVTLKNDNMTIGTPSGESIANTTNTSNNAMFNNTIIINDATDPEKVGNVVVKKLTDIATKWSNSSGRYLRSNY